MTGILRGKSGVALRSRVSHPGAVVLLEKLIQVHHAAHRVGDQPLPRKCAMKTSAGVL